MKKRQSFWGDLEIYTWKTMERVSPALAHLGMVLIGIVILASLTTTKSSVVGARDTKELVERAAKAGDYGRAREMLNVHKSQITNLQMEQIGHVELERQVYPERVVDLEIAKYEKLLLTYPGSRDLYLLLSQLHQQIGNDERSAEYWESARILDPNNEIFSSQ